MKTPLSLPVLMLGLALASPVKAQDVAAYLQGGISGIGLGVSMGWGGPFRVRADLINSTASKDATLAKIAKGD